jgi:hypothetical protein
VAGTYTDLDGYLGCDECGAIVWSSDRHDRWHEAQHVAVFEQERNEELAERMAEHNAAVDPRGL